MSGDYLYKESGTRVNPSGAPDGSLRKVLGRERTPCCRRFIDAETAATTGVRPLAGSSYLNRNADPSNLVWLTNFAKFFSMTSLRISSASSGPYQNTE